MTETCRTIGVITGGRADYGLLYWPMRHIQWHDGLALKVFMTGSHLVESMGNTGRRVHDDGFPVVAEVDLELGDDSPEGICRSTGLAVDRLGRAMAGSHLDLLLVLGDRYEIFAGALAATLLRIPIAHIAGGDITEGAFDDAMRHGLTKLAHLHFVTNALSAQRVRQMGEPADRVFNVGSPGLDWLDHIELLDRAAIEQALGMRFGRRTFLVTWHPETLGRLPATEQVRVLLRAFDRMPADTHFLITAANADPAGRQTNALIQDWVADRAGARFVPSLGQQLFFSVAHAVDAVVGNSSSGLYEIPSLGVPTVNIGIRQQGRVSAESVLHCPLQVDAIEQELHRACQLEVGGVVNPYGDGHSSERIVDILTGLGDWSALCDKRFAVIEDCGLD